MGVSENMSAPGFIAMTYARPFPPGAEGEVLRDYYTGVLFQWSETDSAWYAVLATEKAFTLYVNGGTGNNANAGDAANPLLTISEAIRRLPPRIRHDVVIDVADNAGAVLLYDERVIIENFTLENNATFRIVGKSRQVAAIAANAASTGTNRTWTIVPNPAWVVNVHVGKYVLFSAGPHAGKVAWILANTADTLTLGYRPLPAEGAYGPTDAGDIREISTQLQRSGAPAVNYSLIVKDVQAMQLVNNGLSVEYMHVMGDATNRYAIGFSGQGSANFTGCRVDDLVYANPHTGGYYLFESCLAWTCRNIADGRWFETTPGSTFRLSFTAGGVIGGVCLTYQNPGATTFSQTNFETDPAIPANTPPQLIEFSGTLASFALCSMNGGGIATPIYCSGSGSGDLSLGGMDIFGSDTSGIKCSTEAMSSVHIRIDENVSAALPVSNIHDNQQFGIDLTGPARLSFFNATVGLANQSAGLLVGGVRMRDGAVAGFYGTIGQEPTIQDGAGNKVNFDDRTPALVIGYDVETAGLETQSLYVYRGI